MSAKSQPQGAPGMDVPLIVTIGVASSLLVIVVVIGVWAWFDYEVSREQHRKVVDQPIYEIEQLKTRQLAEITTYRWVDEKAGIAAIPIDRAMKLIAQREGAKR